MSGKATTTTSESGSESAVEKRRFGRPYPLGIPTTVTITGGEVRIKPFMGTPIVAATEDLHRAVHVNHAFGGLARINLIDGNGGVLASGGKVGGAKRRQAIVDYINATLANRGS